MLSIGDRCHRLDCFWLISASNLAFQASSAHLTTADLFLKPTCSLSLTSLTFVDNTVSIGLHDRDWNVFVFLLRDSFHSAFSCSLVLTDNVQIQIVIILLFLNNDVLLVNHSTRRNSAKAYAACCSSLKITFVDHSLVNFPCVKCIQISLSHYWVFCDFIISEPLQT